MYIAKFSGRNNSKVTFEKLNLKENALFNYKDGEEGRGKIKNDMKPKNVTKIEIMRHVQ